MQTVELARKRCQSCTGIKEPLPQAEVQRLLGEISPDWRLGGTGHHLEREIVFENFAEAMRFLNRVAEVAEEEDHHPDFTLRAWNRVHLVQFTYVVDGLTENDFIIAAKIDELLASGQFHLRR